MRRRGGREGGKEGRKERGEEEREEGGEEERDEGGRGRSRNRGLRDKNKIHCAYQSITHL